MGKNTNVSANNQSGATTQVPADFRNGICIKCGVFMPVRDIPFKRSRVIDGETIYTDCIVQRPVCPECGGMIGQLIVRTTPIRPPKPPACISPRCLCKFIMDSLYIAYLSSYHSRRVTYAQARRPEKGWKILERYRTGEPSPKNLWQAIHANLKLKCPICRKYNVDPLLFGGE